MVYFPIMDALYVVMSVTIGQRLAICTDSPES